MIGSHYRNIVLGSAAAFLALSVSVPAWADNKPAAGNTEISSVEVPTPRVRPAPPRKRVATVAPVQRALPRYEPPPFWPRYAAHWPMLYIGVSW